MRNHHFADILHSYRQPTARLLHFANRAPASYLVKNLVRTVLLLLTILGGTSPAAFAQGLCTNTAITPVFKEDFGSLPVVLNNGFETTGTPAADWAILSQSNGAITRQNVTARAGAWAIQATNNTNSGNTLASLQLGSSSFAVTPGITYQVTYWIRATINSSTFQFLVDTNGVSTTPFRAIPHTIATRNTWIQVSDTFTIPATVTTASLVFNLGGTNASNPLTFYLDDINFNSSTVPAGFNTSYFYKPYTMQQDGGYMVTPRVLNASWAFTIPTGGAPITWATGGDHTTGNNGAGNLLLVNAGLVDSVFFTKTVAGLCPGSIFNFSAWLANVQPNNAPSGTAYIFPRVTFKIFDTNGWDPVTRTGSLLASYTTGNVPAPPSGGNYAWQQYGFQFALPIGTTSLVLQMVDWNTKNQPSSSHLPSGCSYPANPSCGFWGDDIAVDDIVFTACAPTVTASVNAGTGACVGMSDTIAAVLVNSPYTNPAFQWQKSSDGGTTWVNVGSPSTTPNLVFTKVSITDAGLYRVIVGPDAASLSSLTCTSISNSVNYIVNTLPTVTAHANTPICYDTELILGTVVTGGTPAYSYHWYGPNNFTSTRPDTIKYHTVYSDSGYYSVILIDSRGCRDTARVHVDIVPVPVLTTINNSDTICTNTAASIALGSSMTGSHFSWQSTVVSGTVSGNTSQTTTSSVNQSITDVLVNNTNTPGVVRYIITAISDSGCVSKADTQYVVVHPKVSIAVAGNDQMLCNAIVTALAANTPSSGTGTWYQIGLPTAILTNPNNANTTVTGLTGNNNDYYFVWKISDAANACPSSADTVVVRNRPATTIAHAGNDTTICYYNSSSIKLNANIDTARHFETGTWTLLSQPTGGNASFGDIHSPSSTFTYNHYGTYQLVWTITNDNCPATTDTVSINLFDLPAPNFTTNNQQCLMGNSFAFSNSSTVANGNISSYNWSFGDGQTSIAQHPSHSYAAAGSYQVTLLATTNNGCKNSTTKTITIAPEPVAAFTINNVAQCLGGNSFSFTSTSAVSSGSIAGYSWTFGDGGSASAQDPVHAYASSGTYQVKLVVTTDNGCKDSTTQTVTVDPKPVAGFATNSNPQCLSSNNFSFTNTSTVSSGSITGYSWTFGDGGSSSAQAPAHIYALSGTYQVKLVVTTNNGCKDSTTQTLTVYPQPINVNYTINTGNQCLSNNSFGFTTNASVGSGTVNYTWNFGDGQTSTQQYPTHSYASAGIYVVKLIVTTNNGCIDSSMQTVTVFPKPIASYTVNTIHQCFGSNIFVFTNTSTVSSGAIVQYNWDFGNGATSSQQAPTYSYSIPGTYQVKLVVTTNNGCKDSTTQYITVSPQPEGVNFSINSSSQCFSGNSFSFNAAATVNSGNITAYNWYFGDGTVATGPTATHNYTAAGTYQVKLVVTTDQGCKDSITRNVTGFPQPVPGFTINTNPQCLRNNSVAFTSTSTVSTGTITAYNWNFGDGQTSTQQSPTHAYTVSGNYQVKLVVTTDNGCKDSTMHNITVYPQPANVDIVMNAGNQCLSNNSFAFNTNATVSSGSIAYTWNFGDGTASNLQNPTHNYAAAGTYPVTLMVATNNGCIDSTVNNVTVYPQPTGVAFTINATSPCVNGNSFAFNTNATVATGTVTYNWDFGDGQTSTLQNPAHTYAVDGTYNIKLVVTTSNGCKDSIIQNVTLHAQPTGVDFSVNANAQCLSSNSFAFTTNATVSTGSITYHWDFGDGQTSTLQNPTNTYATTGTYTVKLVIATDYGCNDTATHNITVYPQPVAGFTSNNSQQCLGNNNFSFTNTSTVSSGTIVQYNWNFGDGGTSTAQNPAHAYVAAGTYIIKLVVTTNQGCKDSITQNVTVFQQPTAMAFTVNAGSQCLNGNSFVFNTNATVGSGTVAYSWSFGDGQTSTLQNPSHSYVSAGTYPVKLIVTTDNGCKDSLTKNITVYAQPLGVDFAFNSGTQCLSSNVFLFTTNASISTGSIGYNWDFGDGQTSTLQNPSHSYLSAGTYPVKLIITTNNGCKDSIVKDATVYAQPTNVTYITNTANQCLNGNSYTFNANAIVATGTLSYSWDFGDGGTAAVQNPTHTFTAAGTYLIKLVVTTNNGCSDSAAQTITVHPQPTAGFVTNNNAQCFNSNSFSFTNTSTISSGSIAYNWSFGDGGNSTAQNPVHAYTAVGTYQVKLIVTSNNGCKDSSTQTITVYPQPTGVSYTVNAGNQCLNSNSFVFTSNAAVAAGILTYSWNFGDGGTSALQDPSHSYTAAGTYQVKLIVTTSNGCKDSTTQTVTVYSQPTGVSYTVNAGNQCLKGNSFGFTTNAGVGGGTVTYNWNFGDGGTSALQNPLHSYATEGTYQVKLIVTTNNGCKDSSIQTVTAYPQPVAGFSTNNNPQCASNNNFAFTNTSTVSSGTMTYSWSFGDGQTSTAKDPAHSYTAAGAYQVKLVVTSNNGCKDSATQTITVYPQPTGVNYSVNIANQCLSSNNFVFTTSAAVAMGTIMYSWDFGDGQTSYLQNPTHSYASSGTYQVKLIVTTNYGCKDSATQTITVYPQPTGVSYTVNMANQCLIANSFAFSTNAAVATGTVGYSWNFGDGGTSTAQNPAHSYAAAGIYQVRLVVTTANGCKDSATQPAMVYPQPVAGFSINNNAQCLSSNNFSFTNTSGVSSGNLGYSWNFGDGGTSTAQDPIHPYAAAGAYQIKLIATSNNGCKDSITQTITVYPKPTGVAFSINTGNQCFSGNSFAFSTNATVATGTITYNWSFGDGGTSAAQNPTYNYASPGSYQVKLVVATNNGCKDSSIRTVTVYPGPIAAFSINSNAQCLSSNNFSFTNASSVNGGSLSYNWTFGDGGTSIAQSPAHSYAAAGIYQVKLIVTSNNGCKDSSIQTITVHPQADVDLTVDAGNQCLNGNSFAFSTNATVASGTITYNWNFGDGQASTVQNPSHSYVSEGAYQVMLVVATNNGCKDSTIQTVTVYPQPEAGFTVSNNAQCLGSNEFSFTNTSSVNNGSITYSWDFGDGQVSTAQDITHSYTAAGIYQVKLIVTSNNGCKDSSIQTVTVYPQPTGVPFIVNTGNQCLNGNSFAFSTNAAVASGTITYNWDFGDGQISAAQNPIHSYALAATYQVKLVVTTSNGCMDSSVQTVTVYPKPIAGFAISNNAQCLSRNNFSFTNTSSISNGNITYSWDFGDGGTSTAQDITHSYAVAGIYQVKLIAISNNGCKDSSIQTVTVYPQPTGVPFTVNAGSQCFSGNSFAFGTNATVGSGTIIYNWTFGDGAISTVQGPTHHYASVGTYQVKLIVTTNMGCIDSTAQTVTVYPQPVAAFTTNSSTQCLSNNSFSFINTSTVSSGNIVAYNWSFGDGGTSTAQDPTHHYASAGTYQVKLIVATNNGCSDSTTQTITVYPLPTSVSYTIHAGSQCLHDNSFAFVSNASVANGTITYAWNFGDVGTSSVQDPIHSYALAGTYQVKLTVTTNNGCMDSSVQTVMVYPEPIAGFAISSNAQCLGNNSFGFTNTSTISSGSIIAYSWDFGDGGTSTAQDPTHNYTSAGTYQVKLIVSTNNGCRDSSIQTVTVYPQPTGVAFTMNAGSQCLSSNSFVFSTNATVGSGNINYHWDFGDGQTSAVKDPTHTFAAAGTYIVKLSLITDHGCNDSAAHSVTVYPQPVAGFTVNNSQQCLSNNGFTFTATSTVSTGSITYHWDFGDGQTSAAQDPAHSYTASGTYQVKLVVTSNNGCRDSIIQPVTVNPQPVAVAFTVNAGNQCLHGNSFVFSTNASVSGGTVAYSWNFGDGGIATVQNPTHTYAAAGTYPVKLMITTYNGCVDSITSPVTVNPEAIAEITYSNQQGCAPYTILPSSIQSIDHPAANISYEWYVNGVLVGTGTTFPGYTIVNDGDTATITLKAISRFGCFNDTANVKFWTVAKPHPVFALSDTVGCGPLSINISNTTPSIGNFQYAWNFGQGQTSTNAQPGTVTFPSNTNHTDTTYTITLTASSVCDAISITKDILVRTKPKTDFMASNLTGCSPITVTFTNTSAGSNIQSFTWLFGDGTTVTTMATTVSHSYTVTTNTTFNVQLIATNSCGSDTATVPISIKPNPININIQVQNNQASGCAPLTVNLSNASSGATSYHWDFGDGNILTTTANGTVTHTYNTVGNYTVTVAATDGCGFDTIRIPVYALPLPNISFTASTAPVCIGDPVLLNNLSETGLIYNWDFGDGYNSTLYSPVHAYTAAGTYTITLTVTRPAVAGNGCTVTLTKQVVIVSQLHGAFTLSDTVGKCLPFAVSFTNQSLPSAQTTWDFGDGTTGTGNNTSHTYTQNGNYVASMVSISPGGCTYVASRNISVTAPVGNFTFPTGYQCANTLLQFQSQAQYVTGYIWDFGDGTVLNTSNAPVSHSYATPGIYHPTLTIKNNDGCNVLVPVTDSIKIDKVVAAFTAQPLQTCLGTSTNFTNNSTAYFGMQQWQWDFGDGGTSSNQHPSHPYSATGTYPVQLITTGVSGCRDTSMQSLNVQVYQVPVASINSNNDACINSSITFNATITGNDPIASYSWTLSNGATSTSSSASTTFTQAGVSTATVIVKTIYGCSATATKTVNIRPLPNVSAGTDGMVCAGNSKQLNATGADTYQWVASPGLSCTNCPNPVATPAADTYYTVVGTSSYGCVANGSVYLRVVAPFVLTANNAVMCRGDKVNLFASGAATYQWSPSNTLSAANIANPIATPAGTTTYTVTGKDAYGCFTRTANVTVTVNPLSTLYIGKDTVTTNESSYQFVTTVGISPAVTWNWTPATALSCTNCPNPFIATVGKDVSYIATITNQWGCRTSDTLRIMAFCPDAKLFIPNILTPDGDGYNDRMIVKAQGIKKVTSVKVFNRWGELVFVRNDFVPNDKTYGWDGTYKGKLVDPDVFVYVCEVICENNRTAFFKGNITVIR